MNVLFRMNLRSMRDISDVSISSSVSVALGGFRAVLPDVTIQSLWIRIDNVVIIPGGMYDL